jgi:hypothetical protein
LHGNDFNALASGFGALCSAILDLFFADHLSDISHPRKLSDRLSEFLSGWQIGAVWA